MGCFLIFSSPTLHPKPLWGGWFLASVFFLFWMSVFSDCVECLTSSFLSSDCRWRCVYFQTVLSAWPARSFPLIAGVTMCVFSDCVECLTSSFLSSDCRWRCVYFQTVFHAWPARSFPLIAGVTMCIFSDCVECLTSSFLSSDCRWRCVYFQTVFHAWPARSFPLIAGVTMCIFSDCVSCLTSSFLSSDCRCDDVYIFRLCWVLDQLVPFLWLQVPRVWRWRASCCRSAWWSSPSCPWRRPPTNWPLTRTSHRSTWTNSFPVRLQVIS